VLEATNLAFNGTLAVNGEAYAIVIRTGDHTVLGQIANMAGSESKRPSPLTVEIEKFVHVITALAVVVAIFFFSFGLANDEAKRTGFFVSFAIGVFVSFVPEGLPATVTMLLSIAAKRMAARNVLVKDLKGVETLGAITVRFCPI
jgi:sodium/potassium-transporting ATPase subunit alpha